jgi:GTP cyclohydrolase IB
MKDVQSEADNREIVLDRVGVNGVHYPITVMDRTNKTQKTYGKINLYVELPKEFRGTHMSRFIEILNKYRNDVSLRTLDEILNDTKLELDAGLAHIEIEFPYFINKTSPVTKIDSFMDYNCKLIATKNDKFDFILEVDVPIHLLCPCSKEISQFSAHNQRGIAKISIRMKKLVWIEELVDIGEKSASAPLYTLLKREDEKYITEQAYQKPRFVEDIARNIALELDKDERITYYHIEVISMESIHNHDAYACLSRTKKI